MPYAETNDSKTNLPGEGEMIAPHGLLHGFGTATLLECEDTIGLRLRQVSALFEVISASQATHADVSPEAIEELAALGVHLVVEAKSALFYAGCHFREGQTRQIHP